ncbi:unnamed protein product [Bursaphelenchus okinawaensis]|uniref:Uncharacterized protein n=1 Tax=Bursaphelenchus okinawaensis TaxID=465554 RepID=A0A811LMC8_9BILA|nr:unnamed protein product [Bursaphelenchus okinawaensis]CAG9125166.1 unnamed protein product [Bursaphelenchus okinawaensis]
MTDVVDAENPEVKPKAKDKWFRFDPGFPVTALSSFMTFGLTQMMVYGVTGNAKTAFFCSLLTFPVSWTMGLMDAEQDFVKWKKTAALREKGISEKFMPYKVKYDWSDYQDKMVLNPDRVKLD